MENSSLGGSCSGPTTLMSGPIHSFIQERCLSPPQKTQVGLGWKAVTRFEFGELCNKHEKVICQPRWSNASPLDVCAPLELKIILGVSTSLHLTGLSHAGKRCSVLPYREVEDEGQMTRLPQEDQVTERGLFFLSVIACPVTDSCKTVSLVWQDHCLC